MKIIGPVLAAGITLVMVMVIAVYSFLPAKQVEPQPVQPAEAMVEAAPLPTLPAVQAGVNADELQAKLAEREAVYQNQISQLQQKLQERQATYQSQLQTINGQLTSTQNQLAELSAQEQTLQAQVAQLEAARAERLSQYQAQLQQAQAQYGSRFSELEAAATDLQTQLAQANAQLGR